MLEFLIFAASAALGAALGECAFEELIERRRKKRPRDVRAGDSET